MTIQKSVTDRRTQRTRRALRDALLSLLVEKSWDELSVQDICARADIGRSTFYLHFPSKEELLSGSLEDLRGVLSASANASASAKAILPLAFIRGLLEHLYEQQQLCRSIFGRRSAHTVQVRFREMVGKLFSENLRASTATSWKREATVRYLTGALVETLSWWIDSKPVRQIDEIEEFYLRLAEPALKEFTRN